MTETFVCQICGESHEGLSHDIGYTLPDIVWAIPEADRAEQAKFTNDCCQYGERYFIRCILLLLPRVVAGQTSEDRPSPEDYFGWGVWVEVERPVFMRYVELWKADGSAEPRYSGTIANAIPVYDGCLGAAVEIQFGNATSRPSVHCRADDRSALAEDQRSGVDCERYAHDVRAHALGG